MDLNIGTAFWFASRGRGYLIPSTGVAGEDSTNIISLYDINDPKTGRPLLRMGAEGALRSVGGPAIKYIYLLSKISLLLCVCK